MKDLCDKLQNGNWSDCPVITLPNCNQPNGDTNQPEMDNGQPGNNSGSVNPDGETNKPEIEDELQEELSYVRQVAKLVNEERAKAGRNAKVFDFTMLNCYYVSVFGAFFRH